MDIWFHCCIQICFSFVFVLKQSMARGKLSAKERKRRNKKYQRKRREQLKGDSEKKNAMEEEERHSKKGGTLIVNLRSRFSLWTGWALLGPNCPGELLPRTPGRCLLEVGPGDSYSDTPSVESRANLGRVSFYWGFGSPPLRSQHRECTRSQCWGPYRRCPLSVDPNSAGETTPKAM